MDGKGRERKKKFDFNTAIITLKLAFQTLRGGGSTTTNLTSLPFII